jgi:predicted TPR repeat methyltransferase
MLGFSTRTSGDLVADRRYAYGDAAFGERDFSAARDLFEQTLELVPHWPPARFALAKALIELGEPDAARAALAAVIAADPADSLGAGLLIARLDGGEPVAAAMPDAYVAGLFDDYAPRFDAHLVEALGYRAPALIAAMIANHTPNAALRDALDLGCGTGLMARALEGQGISFAGCDLSARMLEIAHRTGLYARLARAPLLDFLRAEPPASVDLVIAADVFCYVPDLAPVFAETARVLRPGGAFAFSAQRMKADDPAGAGVVIGADARVHHAPRRIRDWAASAGLAVIAEDHASTRLDRGQPMPGALFLLAKP